MIKTHPSANLQTDFQPFSQTESNLSHVLTLAAHCGRVVRLSSKNLPRKLTSIGTEELASALHRHLPTICIVSCTNLLPAYLPSFTSKTSRLPNYNKQQLTHSAQWQQIIHVAFFVSANGVKGLFLAPSTNGAVQR